MISAEEKKPDKKVKKMNMVQIGIVLFFQLAEPITSQCIYPFINQVTPLLLTKSPLLNTTSTAYK